MTSVLPFFDDPVQLVSEFSLLPDEHMTAAQRLNAITRSVILGTSALYLITGRPELFVAGAGVIGYMTLSYVDKHTNGNPEFMYEAGERPMFPEQQTGVEYSGLPAQVYGQMVHSQSDFAKDLLVEPGTNQRLPLPPTHFDVINGQRYLIQKLTDYVDDSETLFNNGAESLHLQKFIGTA